VLQDKCRRHADDEAVSHDGSQHGREGVEDVRGQKGDDRPEQDGQSQHEAAFEAEFFLRFEED